MAQSARLIPEVSLMLRAELALGQLASKAWWERVQTSPCLPSPLRPLVGIPTETREAMGNRGAVDHVDDAELENVKGRHYLTWSTQPLVFSTG